MELIDREVYRRQVEKSLELMARAGDSQNDVADGMRRALRLLDMQDVVEAVPVVRCRDCKYSEKHACLITGSISLFCCYGVTTKSVNEKYYCGYGERREQG